MRIKNLLAILSLLFVLFSCDSYLDRQPDEPMTPENIFKKYDTSLKYLINVYSFMPDFTNPSGQFIPFEGSSDECSIVFTGRFFATYNRNLVTPTNMSNEIRKYTFNDIYMGIREATYFIQNIDECKDPKLTEVEREQWRAEARFMRAYYYFQMMQVYGPVFLLYDELIDYKDPNLKNRERATWDECVDWVVKELDLAAENLPAHQLEKDWTGRATKGAAKAVKARLLLYSARPLFNGNTLYNGVVTKEGVHLFPQAEDVNKWRIAAQASKDIIDMGEYELMYDETKDAYTNLRNLYLTRLSATQDKSNKELIFTQERGGYQARVVTTPSNIGGTAYGGVGPTQKLVDAFAMDNGMYPIIGYTDNGAKPVVDERSGYSEEGFSNFTNPLFNNDNKAISTFKMYQNREPRFYLNVFWSGLPWRAASQKINEIQFYTGGTSGPVTSHNYPATGYLSVKFTDPSLNTIANSWGAISYPLFRYGEVLLNYVEALNEYEPSNPDILTYWNQIRRRAGVPDIEEVYPDIVGNQDLQRQYIRRERQVELCFEGGGLRFFDTRTWMISNTEDNGPVYGMDISQRDHKPNGAFWKRTQVQAEGGYPGVRIFENKKYLLPIHQGEVERVDFTQNYGWK